MKGRPPTDPPPSPRIVKGPKPCSNCAVLGESGSADRVEDEQLPAEVGGLETFFVFDTYQDIRRCPACGNYFFFEWKVDNDIFQPTNSEKYSRIPADRANQMILDERARIRSAIQYKKRGLYRLHGKVLTTLPTPERDIVRFITEKVNPMSAFSGSDCNAPELEEGLRVGHEALDAALRRLVERGILVEERRGSFGLEKGDERKAVTYRISPVRSRG